ncbi:hypothetical protein [Citrobacter freundii]|uniref:hypothetical protein n=1 Tax=Citrobacter freundii TaxID=546 RepID=UPI0017842AE9|nr:hypothetical protein [Citrobacter freundii]ELQ7794643.1 hypothetical protein [Citrobacter freundii]MBE0099027.1 hypothetical protein [Citrobacter freundii]MEA8857458.1 hypothetical protein [Citrobacter freundii]MEB1001344.1 hypothetical protein [Citrobacter freundii]
MFSFLDENTTEYLKKCDEIINEKYGESYDSAKIKPPAEWNDNELISAMFITSWSLLKTYMNDVSYLERKTKFNRKNIGSYLIDKNMLIADPKLYLSIILRFVWEYNLTSNPSVFNASRICLDRNFLARLDDIESSVWGGSGSFNIMFSWISNVMVFEIYNDFLDSPELKDAKKLTTDIAKAQSQLESKVNDILDKATSSIEYLDAVRNEAKDLGDRLTNIKREGNFKLLAKAFSTIRTNKKDEVFFAQCRMWFFVCLLLLMPAGLFGYFSYKDITFTWLSALRYTPLISLEVLFFYFMRLFYIEVKSLKSQLVQIDLRLNLCEFIYDYVETRDRTHSDKVNDSWKSFEALIFSPIQPNEDKIPSVMDGTDVLADLAGKILKARG